MESKEVFATIDPTTFDSLLNEYPDYLSEKLSALDKERYEAIPESVKRKTGLPSLTKEEVATLVDWKLSHGKFRPTLRSLVQQNGDIDVQDTTKAGFQAFDGSAKPAGVKAALNLLTNLRGIGPATASLLLSVFDPAAAPFFSDELYRWCFWEPGKAKGWDREIKYNAKEYLALYDRVHELIDRFNKDFRREIAAVEIERVAYVLGKRAAGTGNVDEGGSDKKRKAPPSKAELDGKARKARKADPSPKLIDRMPSQEGIVAAADGDKARSTRTEAPSRPKRKVK